MDAAGVVGIAGWVLSISLGVIFGHVLHRLFAEPDSVLGTTRRLPQADRAAERLKVRRAA